MNMFNKTRNRAGGTAYSPDDPKQALRMVTINNLLTKTYYRSEDAAVEELHERYQSASEVDPEYPLKLAVWARQEAYLRDVPQLLFVFAANDERARDYVRGYVHGIIDRPDELNTIVAMNNWYHTGSVEPERTPSGDINWPAETPYVLKRSLADVIESGKFDRYQYAKYRQPNRVVSLHDVFNVAHPYGWHDSPEPTDEQSEIANRITKGDRDDYPSVEPLRQRRTWEDQLSEAGQTDVDKAQVWREVLPEMGLFAIIRNLRNMLEAGVPPESIITYLDHQWVRDSKIYPFRFYQARKALAEAGYTSEILHEWLDRAIHISAKNIPPELVDTLTIVDLSASMKYSVSKRSDLQCKEIASLFGAMLGYRGADIIGFADRARRIREDTDSVIHLQNAIMNRYVGSSTFAHKALRLACDEHIAADRVVIFTDFQIWESGKYGNDPNQFRNEWERYRGQNEDAHLYIADLQSYGELKLPPEYPHVTRVQGWSDSLLDYIWNREQDLEIEAISPGEYT